MAKVISSSNDKDLRHEHTRPGKAGAGANVECDNDELEATGAPPRPTK